jgi:hypothetical protein
VEKSPSGNFTLRLLGDEAELMQGFDGIAGQLPACGDF